MAPIRFGEPRLSTGRLLPTPPYPSTPPNFYHHSLPKKLSRNHKKNPWHKFLSTTLRSIINARSNYPTWLLFLLFFFSTYPLSQNARSEGLGVATLELFFLFYPSPSAIYVTLRNRLQWITLAALFSGSLHRLYSLNHGNRKGSGENKLALVLFVYDSKPNERYMLVVVICCWLFLFSYALTYKHLIEKKSPYQQ